MGHALNNTLQDVLIRWRRMQGYNALWMPGTDHAGIATQAVVERLILQQEKKTRHDLGREELVKRIWQWKDKYEARILGQLKQLGCQLRLGAHALHPRSDLCPGRAADVLQHVQGRPHLSAANGWSTGTRTCKPSVADDETYTETVKGGFWTFKLPACKGRRPTGPEFIRFSTTRPETMLGDTAVRVHPDDERYKHLIGKMVTIPLVNRDIPIIADALLVGSRSSAPAA